MSQDNVQDAFDSGTTALDVDGAADAILDNWKDAEEDQPSIEGNLEATDESTEETEVEESDEIEEDGETEEQDESEEDPVQEELSLIHI